MLRLAFNSSRKDLAEAALQVVVVDNQGQLDGLRRSLRRDRARWDITYCTNGPEAEDALQKKNVDVVVSGLSGHLGQTDVLEFAKEVSPATARIRLVADERPDDLLEDSRVAHQVLSTASDFEVVRSAIERLAMGRSELPDEHLRKLVNGVESLPTPSAVQRELAEVLGREHNLADVADVVETDVALSAELLRLVNSSYFGLAQRITTLRESVGLLGLDLVEATVASRSAFANADDLPIDAEKVNQHSQLVAAVSGYVSTGGGASKLDRSIAVSVGLLHDVGVLVLAQVEPKGATSSAEVLDVDDLDAERLAFGADRYAVGAHLLDLWAFSPRTPETIRELGRPPREVGVGTVAWSVKVAHFAVAKHNVGLPSDANDREWFEKLQDIERQFLLS